MTLLPVVMNQDNDPLAPLARLDLNQLVAMELLLRLGSVTRAAERLGVTQSAMSHTLRRLREAFDDPLLVRGGAAMVATPRAQALKTPLRAALRSLADAIAAPDDFEPASSERTFRLASPDLFDALFFPDLLRRIAQEAPRVSLTALSGYERLGDRLETGDLDAAIVPTAAGPSEVEPGDGEGSAAVEMGPRLPGDLRTRWLLDDVWAPFVRIGHPALQQGPLSARAFAALDHILVSPSGQGLGATDARLAEQGLRRRIAFRAPTFASGIGVAQDTDLVLVAPRALALRAARFGLASLDVELELPRHKITLVWHPRVEADPAHHWLRAHLQACVEPFRDPRRGATGGAAERRSGR